MGVAVYRGSDAFEPKMSLWPLIFGTLKATLYAMLFSVPLALLAAIYVSQLAPSWIQATVKPTVELMAAVPSVVVGFLAALWLAPRLETALFAFLGAIGICRWRSSSRLLCGGAADRSATPSARGRRARLLLLVAGAVGVALVALVFRSLGSTCSSTAISSDFYSPNGAFATTSATASWSVSRLGFAVIPVIFTIAEDACSAVPRSLVSASRALGATRWQTAIRLVVPAASPGLFAAVMLGLGRAVGETMIVLMAAGNTPLLDLSPFNGMRTMSAAIAVEIPEAPVGGDPVPGALPDRTLLFVFTLVLTTAADIVGSYLRKRYARF